MQSLNKDDEKISGIINKFRNLENINQDVIDEFIEKISIDKNRDFHIDLNFKI